MTRNSIFNRLRQWCWATGGILGVFATSTFCLADGTIRDGMGARSIGRGGTNLAFADNAHVMLDNPAGLIRNSADGIFEIGGHLMMTDLEYSDADNPSVGDIDNPFPLGEIAFGRKLSDSVAVGFGAFSVGGFSAEYLMNGPGPAFGGREHYKSMSAMARLLPTLSLQLTERLSMGATLGAAINHVELEGPYTLQTAAGLAGTPTRLDLQATGIAPSWSLGGQYALSEATTIGVAYQHETEMTLDGSTSVTIPGVGTARYDSTLAVAWPRSLGVGIAHRLTPERTLGFDAIWYDWSRAHDQFDLSLRDPNNPVFQAVAPTLEEAFPLSWRDTVSLRVGIQQELDGGRVLRAGYVYHRNPIPAATQTVYIQTAIEHAISVGYGWRAGDWAIDAAYQLLLAPDLDVGTNDLLGDDFDNSTASVTAHQVSLSFQRVRRR
ncbi:MAG: outer membrane protein transport protein [Planctomycetota bacterium]